MKTRFELDELLRDLTEFDNIYYQPPSHMNYPCILYQKDDYDASYADDIRYKNKTKYQITLIGKNPDNEEVCQKLLSIMYCSFDRRYKTSENLYHDVFILYW